ncbi:MAG: LysM peptidoglycan-binding domain-containing protein [Kiritimatiellae bacterium]|nr:LysM peptidoglycan-binding domain-containing protein [Kiritimatiellia bacterium]MDW8458106.1 LysM peptidoglycan-binding domain-containing protein [Verrucomicrobiota bacterium]
MSRITRFGLLVGAWLAAAGAAMAQTSHVVRAGDTLERIARQYGVRTSALIAANDLERPDELPIGKRLIIPRPDEPIRKRYTVEEGDTLQGIARDHGLTADQLARLNRLDDPNKLKPGQILEIPLDATRRLPSPKYPLPENLRRELDQIPVRPGRWRYIVIHHSATDTGNAQTMDHYHRVRRRMENGLAYHFVIGNGRGMPDGQIAIGRRWRTQIKGGHLASDALNEIAIGICLVGNFEKSRPTPAQVRSLSALISYLMQRTRNSASAVRTHRQINTKPTICPGRHFPTRAILENLP